MIPPTGIVTFLFTDIEGSTKLSQEFPEILNTFLVRHNSILNDSVSYNNGFVFKITGDSFCCAFQNAEDAIKASVEAQKKLNSEDRKEAVIKVRMGIHSGMAEWSGTDYMGYITLARTARVMSAAYGGQILISEKAYEIRKIEFLKDVSFRDLGNRRLKDLIQPVRLYQILSADIRADFPPLKTLDARPNNLRVQLTSFIGREKEIAVIKKLLSDTRLLTLIGPGGTGKTRLSLQVAADLIDEYANGVFICELAAVSDPSFILQTIMDSIQVKEEPEKSLYQTLIDFLREKEILMILDNCEHLIAGCSDLAEKLLQNCPGIKIIATSREALNCSGEQTYRLPSLSVPGKSNFNSPEQLTQYESVRLFIERALSVNHNFRVNNDNAPALAGICIRLDGIPLAIELASARTKVLSVEKIFERLDNRFNLLTGGSRTALPRQQTLKALIDWSYDLLSEEEKILWGRLSVFSEGWTLESAEGICSDEKIAEGHILDLLSHLVEKSIISYDEEKDRYSILETLNQYGEGKLKESNEEEKLFSKHLNYFAEHSSLSYFKISGKTNSQWLDHTETEHNNFISAIDRSVISGEKEKGSLIAAELGHFWITRGHYLTGIKLIESLLNDDSGISKHALSKLFSVAGNLNRAQGKFEKARKFYERGLSLSREIQNKNEIAVTLIGIGNVEAEIGNFEKAQSFFEESLKVSRECNFDSGISFSLNNLGNVALIMGNFNLAEMYTKESLEINRKTQNKHDIAFSLDTMGNIMTETGNLELAQEYLEESLKLTREIGDKSGIAFALMNLSGISNRNGNQEQALSYLEESLRLRIELDDKPGIAYALFGIGSIYFDQKKYEQAGEYYKESLKIRTDLRDKFGIALSLYSFSRILNNDEKLSDSVKLLAAADTIIRSIRMDVNSNDFRKQSQIVEDLHNKLSDKEFSEYYEEGKNLTIEEACSLAVRQCDSFNL